MQIEILIGTLEHSSDFDVPLWPRVGGDVGREGPGAPRGEPARPGGDRMGRGRRPRRRQVSPVPRGRGRERGVGAVAGPPRLVPQRHPRGGLFRRRQREHGARDQVDRDGRRAQHDIGRPGRPGNTSKRLTPMMI